MSVKDYWNSIKRKIYDHHDSFENAWNGANKIQLKKTGKESYELSLKGHEFLLPEEKISPESEFPLRFNDGSIFTFAQTLYVPNSRTVVIEESVVTFAKVGEDNVLKYIFHYDKIMESSKDHPLYHLQFAYDNKTDTPRFPIRDYHSIGDILDMIINQKLVE